jgi:hypothetical protein
MEIYPLNDIGVHGLIEVGDDRVDVFFSCLAETMYYSPGVIVTQDAGDRETTIVFPRVKFTETVQVDVSRISLARWREHNPDAAKDLRLDLSAALGPIFTVAVRPVLDRLVIKDQTSRRSIWPHGAG